MSLVEFNNKSGLVVTPFSQIPNLAGSLLFTINAVGKSMTAIGQVRLTSGPGTSKVISPAGGKIYLFTSSVTWATAGSTMRAGIQDVALPSGLEDGVYDVFDDLVQGVDAIPANASLVITMSSGTKTIADGDLIAVVFEMTVRNGTDSITMTRIDSNMNLPYSTIDNGAGPIKSSGTIYGMIQFDDGTIGHFGEFTLPITDTAPSFGNGSTPDEYAMVFQLPFKCTINALFLRLSDVDAGDDATVHLIQDPLGAITNLQTVSLNAAIQQYISGVGFGYTIIDIPETTILAGVVYAVSYRPTTAGVRSVRLAGLPIAAVRSALPILISGATRTDLGVFANSLVAMPDFGFKINKIDDGTGVPTSSEVSAAYLG